MFTVSCVADIQGALKTRKSVPLFDCGPNWFKTSPLHSQSRLSKANMHISLDTQRVNAQAISNRGAAYLGYRKGFKREMSHC